MKEVLLKDFRPKCLLNVASHVPEQARFPVIDAHNHLFGDLPAEKLIEVMDAVGVRMLGERDRQRHDAAGEQHLHASPGASSACLPRTTCDRYPGPVRRVDDGRLRPVGRSGAAARTTISPSGASSTWRRTSPLGACGLKVTKELGLVLPRPRREPCSRVDDERLAPIWQRAGELGVPVLIHVSDPIAFFQPIDEHNEHYLTLQEFPGWSFAGSPVSQVGTAGAAQPHDRRAIPATTFLLPHVANLPEDLAAVGELLDAYPNVVIDFSARIDELGRQPYTARDFFIRYQDRILFGLDMPVSAEAYRCYFRLLETRDEYFDYPDYIGRFGVYTRWKLYRPGPARRRAAEDLPRQRGAGHPELKGGQSSVSACHLDGLCVRSPSRLGRMPPIWTTCPLCAFTYPLRIWRFILTM